MSNNQPDIFEEPNQETQEAMQSALNFDFSEMRTHRLPEDDEGMDETNQIVITEEEINILHGRTTFNLYTNDVDMDHGVHDTSHSWYVECSLFNSPLIKYVAAESFSSTVSVEKDEVVLNVNPTSDMSKVKDLRYIMPLV